ncbi:TspO/MBR-related_protein [Hexamita inflata]|uniref:TspO/MBR-related_protein n=1 Tax=Hexamita inflata TaxID=28002 RepID=A0ABP1GJY1_9EUKA
MFLKLLFLTSIVFQYMVNASFDVSKAAHQDNITILNPPDYVFSIWGLIYLLQLFQTYYTLKNTQPQLFYWVQILAAAFNSLWIILFCHFENWFWQMMDLVMCYVVLFANMQFFVKWENSAQFICKLYSCIYIGWITQAQMLAVLIWNRHALFMQELTLARGLLLLALILDVVVSIKFNAGYVCVPQLIALLTLIPKIKSDFALCNASKIGIIIDILLIAYQIIKDLKHCVSK